MNPWQGLNKLPKDLWILSGATLINRSGTMVLPFLALYLTKQLNISPANAGLVITCYGLGALITNPFVGRLSDKLGALKVIKLSLIFSGLFLFIYPFLKDFSLILIVTIIWAIINEAYRPANLSLISELVTVEQRRPAYALNRLAINLGMSIGPVVGGFLSLVNFSLLFVVDAFTAICAGLFLVLAPWKNVHAIIDADETHLQNKSIFKSIALKDLKFIFFVFAMLPVQIVFFQHQASMALYLVKDLGFVESTYGMLFAINTVLIILFEVPLNNSLNHWSDRKLLIIGSLLTGIGFGAMAFARDIFTLVITIVVWTFGEMILFPASAAYMAEIASPKKRGEYMGFFQMSFSLAFTIGPWLGTIVLVKFGSVILWLGALMFGVLSALLMMKLPKHETSPK
ncbi:MAG: MFS transporter [Ignavibacteriaceae bacterium]